MTELKPVAEAQQSIFSMMARAKTESCALDAAHGRVLATDITAQTDHPAADISAMDGYALASAGKILAKGTCFELAGEAAAGIIPPRLLVISRPCVFSLAPICLTGQIL